MVGRVMVYFGSHAGSLGGRPLSGKRRPTDQQLAERLYTLWWSNRSLRRRGIKAALAQFVRDLATEYDCDERTARRWIASNPLFDLLRRR
jgi:hypothetical protein